MKLFPLSWVIGFILVGSLILYLITGEITVVIPSVETVTLP